ncbi:NAD-dependent epimerase/dehydratase family protein [Deinococcus aetherius]|uniref:NAD-dependent epimerase/dehydratase family protein n=1 Tax=Deinococcus aetherius TaxID=200252 RepID=UPI002230DBC9|nr:NAD(P)-dependent oxidoreductase [Deinococcus aetherius]
MNARRVVVTGSSGKAGRAVVRELLKHGYDVTAVDLVPFDAVGLPRPLAGNLRADLTDFGQTLEVLRGMDGVVHLANIPAPGLTTPGRTFLENTAMNFAVFSAAVQGGLKRVVWASSETTLGLPFDTPPRYAPVDEEHFPLPESTYALSKVVGETLAEQFARWSKIGFVGLRISNIMEPHDYAAFPGFWADAHLRKWNLWGYVDARDVAQACRLGLEADVSGARSVIVAAADTVMNRPSRELMAEVFPGVPVAPDLGDFGTLLSVREAGRVLGYVPGYSWRSMVTAGRLRQDRSAPEG